MKKYEIIDSHCHIYPSKIAEKASLAVGDFYDAEMRYRGGEDFLLKQGKAAGISQFVISSVATTTHQVKSINDFILEQAQLHSEFIPFMTLFPNMKKNEILTEVERCEKLGVKGIKLHPDFQKFEIDDQNVFEIYKIASGRLPILFHTGDRRYNYSNPYRLANVLKQFPDLKAIGAHFGGYSEWDMVKCYQGLKNIYIDTSSSLLLLTPEFAKELIDFFGVDHVFFATDYPMWDASEELERFLQIELTEEEREQIFAQNIKKFLQL